MKPLVVRITLGSVLLGATLLGPLSGSGRAQPLSTRAKIGLAEKMVIEFEIL